MNAMSARQVTKENVWFYYNKLMNFEAHCKFCTNYKDSYINYTPLYHHLNDTHKKYFESITDKNLKERPYIYFNAYDKKCYICNEDIQTHNFHHHLKGHSKSHEIIAYEIMRSAREFWQPYVLKTNDDGFTGQCAECKEMICLDVLPTLDHHMRQAHLILLNLPIDTDFTLIPPIITNEIQLWKHYTKLDYNFQAKCNQCTFQTHYIKTTNIIQHIEKEHPQVISYEGIVRSKYPWIYFKYHSNEVLQCLICLKYFPNIKAPNNHDLKYHMDISHSPEKLDHERYNCNWIWKYLKINGNVVECTLVECTFKMYVELELLNLDHHIHSHIHLKIDSSKANISRPYDVDESSGSEPKRMKTDD